MGTVAKAWMIPDTAHLGAEGVSYDDKFKFAFAANDVDHQVQVDTSIRVEFGAKIWRKCKRVGRKTCSGVRGTSRGKLHKPCSITYQGELIFLLDNNDQ